MSEWWYPLSWKNGISHRHVRHVLKLPHPPWNSGRVKVNKDPLLNMQCRGDCYKVGKVASKTCWITGSLRFRTPVFCYIVSDDSSFVTENGALLTHGLPRITGGW